MNSFLRAFWPMVCLSLCTTIAPRAVCEPSARKVAVFAQNHSDKVSDDKIPFFESLLASKIAAKDFAVITREAVTRSLKEAGTTTPSVENSLDKALESQSTALRLAQTINADFVLMPAIESYGSEKRTFEGNGVKTLNVIHTLRLSYKIADGNEGGAIDGATVLATKTVRQTEGLQIEAGDLLNELFDDAATQLADILSHRKSQLPPPVAKSANVTFSVSCSPASAHGPLTIPDIRVDQSNKVEVKPGRIELLALEVTVELDGTVLGSAPGQFNARPGLHKIRLTREGFRPWERTINIFDGQRLNVALDIDEEFYKRWKDTVGFLEAIETNRKLTDADVKLIEGMGQMFSQSGLKLDFKVDTKEGLTGLNSIFNYGNAGRSFKSKR